LLLRRVPALSTARPLVIESLLTNELLSRSRASWSKTQLPILSNGEFT
jgi:hypothetical protein